MIIAETILLLSVSTAVAAERGTETHLPASGPVRAAQAAPAAAAEDSVAIIAFSNISGIAEDDWIGMGIAETLAAELERAGNLSVVRREAVSGALENVSSAADIAGATELAAGRLVGAQWVISGAYQRVGDRIRMTARVCAPEYPSRWRCNCQSDSHDARVGWLLPPRLRRSGDVSRERGSLRAAAQ